MSTKSGRHVRACACARVGVRGDRRPQETPFSSTRKDLGCESARCNVYRHRLRRCLLHADGTIRRTMNPRCMYCAFVFERRSFNGCVRSSLPRTRTIGRFYLSHEMWRIVVPLYAVHATADENFSEEKPPRRRFCNNYRKRGSSSKARAVVDVETEARPEAEQIERFERANATRLPFTASPAGQACAGCGRARFHGVRRSRAAPGRGAHLCLPAGECEAARVFRAALAQYGGGDPVTTFAARAQTESRGCLALCSTVIRAQSLARSRERVGDSARRRCGPRAPGEWRCGAAVGCATLESKSERRARGAAAHFSHFRRGDSRARPRQGRSPRLPRTHQPRPRPFPRLNPSGNTKDLIGNCAYKLLGGLVRSISL
ncbi:unnamed protein product, partial [Iphiclides podalirius]